MKYMVAIIICFFDFIQAEGSNPEPFSRLSMSIQFEQNINHNDFHNYWKTQNGFNISYYTPFYFGNLLAGFNYLSYNSKKKTNPDYQSYFIYSGLEYNINLIDNFAFVPGIRFGNYLMNFNIESEGSNKYESEICIEYIIKLVYRMNKDLQINWEIGKKYIYTYKDLNFLLFKAGVTFRLSKPDWLEDFFE